jgi:Raf kinase inhibitor-like YbhB/YbcL family protein
MLMRKHCLTVLLALALALGSTSASAQNPQPAGRGGGRGGGRRTVEVMKVSTTAWQDGGAIPPKYAQPGRDVSPPISWSSVPEGTASFVLIAHDVDGATGNGTDDVLHWLVWNIPKDATSLPEGVPQSPERPDGSRQISVSGPYYRGPAAPSTGPAHHYVFELFALDTLIDVQSVGVQPGPTRTAVMAAMAGHVRGKGALVGTFKRAP